MEKRYLTFSHKDWVVLMAEYLTPLERDVVRRLARSIYKVSYRGCTCFELVEAMK